MVKPTVNLMDTFFSVSLSSTFIGGFVHLKVLWLVIDYREQFPREGLAASQTLITQSEAPEAGILTPSCCNLSSCLCAAFRKHICWDDKLGDHRLGRNAIFDHACPAKCQNKDAFTVWPLRILDAHSVSHKRRQASLPVLPVHFLADLNTALGGF